MDYRRRERSGWKYLPRQPPSLPSKYLLSPSSHPLLFLVPQPPLPPYLSVASSPPPPPPPPPPPQPLHPASAARPHCVDKETTAQEAGEREQAVLLPWRRPDLPDLPRRQPGGEKWRIHLLLGVISQRRFFFQLDRQMGKAERSGGSASSACLSFLRLLRAVEDRPVRCSSFGSLLGLGESVRCLFARRGALLVRGTSVLLTNKIHVSAAP